MRIELTNNQAQRLLTALRNVDGNDAIKLAGLTRLDIARNINRLFPEVGAFERMAAAQHRGIMRGDSVKGPSPEEVAANNKVLAELETLGQATKTYKLIALEHDKLRLDDNPRITGDMIAALAPILKDFDTMKDAAE